MTDVLKLLELARKARINSYAPYSHYKVGAALLTKTGMTYTGCNIENASFTPTVCAERTALFKAVSDGETEFEAIAIVGGKGGIIDESCIPCGVCLQVISEFCDKDFCVYVQTSYDDYKRYLLGELMPHGFSGDNIER